MSPILFTNNACIAALFAWRRVYQKLISRYDANPTPSQPKKSWSKFPEEININIKKVNKVI